MSKGSSFWSSPRHNSSSIILLFVTLVVVSVIATAIHEIGHLIVALIFGQRVASFNPLSEVTLVSAPPAFVATIFNFSGGLFSALIFGVAYIVFVRKPRGYSLFWLGVPLMFACFLELINGMEEGFLKFGYIVALVLYPATFGVILSGGAAISAIIFSLFVYYVLSSREERQSKPIHEATTRAPHGYSETKAGGQ